MKCVKDHKEIYGCRGLKGRPIAPVAVRGGEKYTEDLFVKDYAFLEGVSTYTGQLEHHSTSFPTTNPKSKLIPTDPIESERKTKQIEFKKIQKVAKMAELRLLPPSFSRSKQNTTHLIKLQLLNQSDPSSNDDDQPEKQTTRRGRIAWTIDFIRHDNCALIETRHEITDDTPLHEIIPQKVKRAFLRNESRLRGIEKWKEIGAEQWGRTLGMVLAGGRCFEYPQIAFEFDEEISLKNETNSEIET